MSLMTLFVVCMVASRGLPADGVGGVARKLIDFSFAVLGFVGFAAVPITLFGCLAGRNRKYWIESNELFAAKGEEKTTRLDLDECTYFCLGRITSDVQGFYMGALRPRILVSNGNQHISLGFTEESAIQWSQYFDSVKVKREPRFPFTKALAVGFVTMIFGAVIGFLVHRIVVLAGGPVIPLGSLCFIGALDGAILGASFVLLRSGSTKAMKLRKRPVLPILLAGMTMSGLGLQWSNVWQVGVANGIIGALGSWVMLPHAEFHETEI